MTIDPKFNGAVRAVHDAISAMGRAADLAELTNQLGFACGYAKALYDLASIPKSAFESLNDLAISTRNQVAERNGIDSASSCLPSKIIQRANVTYLVNSVIHNYPKIVWQKTSELAFPLYIL